MKGAQVELAGERSKDIRVRRAAERRSVYALPRLDGHAQLAALLDEQPAWLSTIALGRFLMWPRSTGRASTTALLARASAAVGHYVSAEVSIGELSGPERAVLAAALRGEPVRPVSHRCSSCGFDKPYVEFALNGSKPVRGGGGWVDPNGDRRRSVCLRCRREEYHETERREYLPAEPFVRWLERKFTQWSKDHRGGHREFAATLGLAERRLTTYINREQDRVSLKVADRVLTHEGSTHLWELWPHLYPVDEEVAA